LFVYDDESNSYYTISAEAALTTTDDVFTYDFSSGDFVAFAPEASES
jgi:hypothetical protein